MVVLIDLGPDRVGRSGVDQEIKEWQVSAHGAFHTVGFDWIEGPEEAEELERVFSNPVPGTHFEREWKKVPVRTDSEEQVIPQVSMSGVVLGLRLKQIHMIGHHPIQQFPESMNLMDAMKGLPGLGVGKPKLIL
jgi:hypothetical protein